MSRINAGFPLDRLLELTDNGKDIFEWELGRIPHKNISSPLRSGDKAPSFRVRKTSSGMWRGIDFNGSFNGNAIDFVAERYGLSLPAAIEKIVQDLGLKQREKEYTPIVRQELSVDTRPLLIEFTDKPFTPEHHAYFNRGHLTEEFLRKNDIYAVDKWAIEKRVQKIQDDEIVFAYWAEDIDRTKILRIGPNVEGKDKWRSGIDNGYIWSLHQCTTSYPDVFISKSRKDEMVLRMLGYKTMSVQNESSSIFLANGAEDVLNCCSSPIINFGTDPQGKQESIKITKELNCRWFNIHNHLYDKFGIEDNFEFVSKFGLNVLDNLIKLKGFKKYGI